MSSSPPCPADCCGTKGEWWREYCSTFLLFSSSFFPGVATSPNYPDNYPNNVQKTETIQVEQGLILSLRFTAFDIQSHSTCAYDNLTITDWDGTTLMNNSCGYSYLDPSSSWYFPLPIITTRSNRVEIFFHTDGSISAPGWSLSWSAVTPG